MDCHHYDCLTCPYPDCIMSGVEVLRMEARENKAQQGIEPTEYKPKPKTQKEKKPKMPPNEYRAYRLAYFKQYYAEHREEIRLKRKLKREGKAQETVKEHKSKRAEYDHAYYMAHREEKKAYVAQRWREGNG